MKKLFHRDSSFSILDRLCLWIARHLPIRLIKWCYIQGAVVATTGKYSDTVVPEITMMDALKRIDEV